MPQLGCQSKRKGRQELECRGELVSFRTSRIRFLFWELLHAGHCRATESCDYEHIQLTRLKVGKDLYWMGL